MSVLNGPGEGTWSVFAVKVVAERDEARAETARLRRLLNMAEDELIAADDHGRREAKRADTVEAEVEALKAERDEWRDKFLALNQTAGELCNACGWAFKIPGESCRCEVIKERDEARAEVEHAYREGGALYEAKIAEREAFRSGAEAMRKRCAMWVKHNSHEDGLGMGSQRMESALAALPIPEEP